MPSSVHTHSPAERSTRILERYKRVKTDTVCYVDPNFGILAQQEVLKCLAAAHTSPVLPLAKL
jgi:hypothetical protein